MSNHIKKVFVLICIMVFCQHLKAQNIRVEAKLDKASILMGDQTFLRINAYLTAKTVVSFPVLKDSLSSKIQIVKVGQTDTIKDKNNPEAITLSRSYLITSFDPGIQMVPSLIVKTADANFKTNTLPLEVLAVKVDTTKAIFDIKEPIAVSYTWVDWVRDNWKPILITIVALAIFVALIYYYLKNRKKQPVIVQSVPQIPAHIAALDKLLALKEENLWKQDQVKEYYSELTDILREYLEKRYKIQAQEQTTDEILVSLKHADLQAQHKNKLQEVLLLADLVKFAKGQPLSEENEQSMEIAIEFVKETKPLPVKPINKDAH